MSNIVSANVQIHVPFHDVDQLGIVWHGHYVKYLEIARCELLKKIQYDYSDMLASGYIWPVVDLQIKYVGSALYDQTIDIFAELIEYENRIKIRYLIKNKDGTILTKATTTQVAVNSTSNELELCSPQVLIDNVERLKQENANLTP